MKLGVEASPRMSNITVNDKALNETQAQIKNQLGKIGAITGQAGEGSGASRPGSAASRSRQMLAKKLADRQPTVEELKERAEEAKRIHIVKHLPRSQEEILDSIVEKHSAIETNKRRAAKAAKNEFE